jgi:hypothetical protein
MMSPLAEEKKKGKKGGKKGSAKAGAGNKGKKK